METSDSPRRRVAVYARVSTDKQATDNQVTDLLAYCNHKTEFEVYKVFTDVVTGTKDSRPAFDLMFYDARRQQFDVCLFWSIDRFSRSGTLFTLQKLKELEGLGIDWHSLQEPYFSTLGTFRDAVISILATLAKMERERISERTKAGLRSTPNRGRVGKRGRDNRPRKWRSDKGSTRQKMPGLPEHTQK